MRYIKDDGDTWRAAHWIIDTEAQLYHPDTQSTRGAGLIVYVNHDEAWIELKGDWQRQTGLAPDISFSIDAVPELILALQHLIAPEGSLARLAIEREAGVFQQSLPE
jgi:hypothetical protein